MLPHFGQFYLREFPVEPGKEKNKWCLLLRMKQLQFFKKNSLDPNDISRLKMDTG